MASRSRRGYTSADDSDIITVWIAITDATEENSCLQAIPTSHDVMLPHCPKVQTVIADGYIQENQAVPMPIKAGGIVLIHPLTPHSSLSNVTDGYRWSFDLCYNVTGQDTGRRQFPDFVARSRSCPDTELHDWTEWQHLWHQARHKAANSAHIPHTVGVLKALIARK